MIERKVVGMLFAESVILGAGLLIGWDLMSGDLSLLEGVLSLIEKFVKRYIHFGD